VRIQTLEWSFEELFAQFFYPIWEYGKKDFYIQNAMLDMLEQLRKCDKAEGHKELFSNFINTVTKQIEENEFGKIN